MSKKQTPSQKRRNSLLRRFVTREAYEIECNAKNEAYAFILSRGYFVEFAEFHNQQQKAHANNFVTAFEEMVKIGAKLAVPAQQPAAADSDTADNASASASTEGEGKTVTSNN